MINFLLEHWEFTATILLLIIGVIANKMPSDNPTKIYINLFAMALTRLLEDKSTVKDIRGKNISHNDIKAVEKIKRDPVLMKRFRLFNRD